MGNDSPEKEEELRIVDKRRFTSEGETKPSEVEGERSRRPEVEAKKSPSVNQPAPEAKAHTPPRAGDESPVDFISLVMSLATQALVLLGEVPNSEAGNVSVNLPAARQTIEILSMLEVKTKGNLTKEEEQLLTEVLSSLRLTFVSKSKQR